MSENVQTFSGKVNVADNLLVGTSHFFVDRQNNRVGIGTSTPDASSMLDVTGNIKSGGTITATGGFSGNGSGLSGVNSDSGSWVNGSSSNIHLAVSTDNVGIGVLDPSSKLDVDGDINIATGSTLKVGGTPAVFSNWSVDGSDIYRSSGNVGIGVTPGVALDVAGTIRGTGGIITGTSETVLTVTNTTTPAILRTLTTGGQVYFQSGTAATSDSRANINFTSMYNATNYLTIEGSTGNVGIPTTSEFKLDVGGSLTSGRSLVVRSGDTNAGTDSIQILFGYANGLDYAHSIRTRHNSAGYDNAIDFWCWDTSTVASTYGNKRVMSVEAKEIGGSREGLVTVHGVMKATSQPRWCWYGPGSSGWSNSGYLTYSANMVTQTRIGGSSSGGYAVAQVAGVYYVSWCAFTENNVAVGTGVQYEIRKNNGGHIRNYHNQPQTNYSAIGGLSCLIPLNVGDHVRVYINSAVHHNANSCFSGFLVA